MANMAFTLGRPVILSECREKNIANVCVCELIL